MNELRHKAAGVSEKMRASHRSRRWLEPSQSLAAAAARAAAAAARLVALAEVSQ